MGNPSNYPPGCTSAHVEAAFGGDDDGPCGAQSPDGLYECTNPYEHGGETHAKHVESIVYSQVNPCWNINCPKPSPGGYECMEEHAFGEPGSWVSNAAWGGEASVVVATWPQREDDFDEGGSPTSRGKNAIAAQVPA